MMAKVFAEIESAGFVVTLTAAEVLVRFTQNTRSNGRQEFVRKYRFQPGRGGFGPVLNDSFSDHCWLLGPDRNFPKRQSQRVASEKPWQYVGRFAGVVVFSLLWFYGLYLTVRL